MRPRKYTSFEKLVSALRDLSPGEPYKVLCFDVFDTLVFRRCHPRVITEGLGRWAKEKCIRLNIPFPQDILESRERVYQKLISEKSAQGLDLDCTLTELCYHWALEFMPANPEHAKSLAAELENREVEIEKAACFPNPLIVQLLPYLKSRGFRLIFASDMYLGSYVHEILKNCGFENIFDHGYVSGELALLKRTGRLFGHILEQEKIGPEYILHVGDNPEGDGRRPVENAINAWVIRDKKEIRRTNGLEFDWIYTKHDPAYAGYAVAAFAQYPVGVNGSFEESLGARSLGPIYASFIHRVAERGAAEKLENIFFPAREGSILKELFLEIAPLGYKNLPLPNAIYIGLSRYTTMLYAMKEFGLRELTRILSNTSHISIRNILAPLRLPAAMLEKAASDYGVKDVDAVLPVAYLHWGSFQRILFHPLVRDHLQCSLARTKKLMNAYLEQRGFFNSPRVGVVDIGWNAQIQENLYFGMLDRPDCPQLFGFYLATRLTAHWTKTPFNWVDEGILADETSSCWHRQAVFEFPMAFEVPARAPHGTVVDYDMLPDGEVIPVFKSCGETSREAEKKDDIAIAQLQTGLRAYAKNYRIACELFGFNSEHTRPYADLMIDRLIRFPKRQEALLFLRMSNVNDLGSNVTITFGDNVQGIDSLFKAFLKLRPLMRTSYWRNGVLAIIGLGIIRPVYILYLTVRTRLRRNAICKNWENSKTLTPPPVTLDDYRDKIWKKPQNPSIVRPQAYEIELKKEEARLAALGNLNAKQLPLVDYTEPLSLYEGLGICLTARMIQLALRLVRRQPISLNSLSLKSIFYRALYSRSPQLARNLINLRRHMITIVEKSQVRLFLKSNNLRRRHREQQP